MWHFVSEYLLLHSDKLELKNIGTFSAKTLPTYIDEKTHKASPAKRIFEFTSSAEETSDDFIEFVAQKLNKTEEQARNFIDEETQKSIKELEKQNKIEIPLIGYMQLTNNHPRLVQTINYSLHPDNFGFTDIPLPEIGSTNRTKKTYASSQTQAQKTKKQKTVAENKKQTQKTKTTKTKEVKTKKAKEQPRKEKEKEKKTSKTAIILTGAIIILLITAFLLKNNITSYFKPQQKKQTEQAIKHNTQSTQQNVVKANNQSKTSNTSSQQQQTQATTNQAKINTQQNNIQTQQNQQQLLSQVDIKAHIYLGPSFRKYYLIVGSFRQIENAQKFKNELISAGYTNADILTNDPTKKRVYLDAFDDLQKAVSAYKEYKARYPKRGIWLLINSNNEN